MNKKRIIIKRRIPERNKDFGIFDIVDDWLKRDRFIFIGWSG